MKLPPKVAGLIREWVDCVLFADFETVTSEVTKGRSKGITTGARIIHTERRAAWDAKNRYGLPPHMPLSFSDFEAARRVPASREAELEALLAKAPKDLADTVTAWLDEQTDKRGSVARAIDRLNARLALEGDNKEDSNDATAR